MRVDGQWVSLADQSLVGSYHHGDVDEPVSPETAEYVVPVDWQVDVPESQAYREPGMFASQHSACKLRQQFTLDRLAQHFALAAAPDV